MHVKIACHKAHWRANIRTHHVDSKTYRVHEGVSWAPCDYWTLRNFRRHKAAQRYKGPAPLHYMLIEQQRDQRDDDATMYLLPMQSWGLRGLRKLIVFFFYWNLEVHVNIYVKLRSKFRWNGSLEVKLEDGESGEQEIFIILHHRFAIIWIELWQRKLYKCTVQMEISCT